MKEPSQEQAIKLDALAIGAHPDDVELGCGGTVAKLARLGRRVGILHLTRGERGTRGTVEERLAEAAAAAAALGAAEVLYLDCGDGALRTGPEEEDALIEILRSRRPELVLGPSRSDRHPDHGRAHRLTEAACYYAGLANRGSGAPHRPAAFFSYMQNDSFEPSFVVDVTADWETKRRSLRAYRSQLFQADAPEERRGEPVTKVSTEDFSLMIEGRARHYGSLIGATFGEPFWNRLPLAVGDPFDILPGGVR
ncbi:MAG TPA: bacillithiol biosynthesis deacetylase BshB1 [Thermoanaerobaculia bacterium]|nr:bacillithiol biosynthesis deacetylase BshB1 [Thermoanaerobaculia bacterium]